MNWSAEVDEPTASARVSRGPSELSWSCSGDSGTRSSPAHNANQSSDKRFMRITFMSIFQPLQRLHKTEPPVHRADEADRQMRSHRVSCSTSGN